MKSPREKALEALAILLRDIGGKGYDFQLETIRAALTAPDAVDERGILHNAFWEAYKNLDENIRKRFSIHTGRKFANEIYDELLKRRAK